MNVPLVEFMYLAFTRMPNESYRRRLRSLLLCLCDVFRALINSLCVLFISWRHVNVPLVEFMYLSFTRMPGENYLRRLRCLCLCDVFRALINSLCVLFLSWRQVNGFVLVSVSFPTSSL